jgi:two-component system CheB/CheR fusion protein
MSRSERPEAAPDELSDELDGLLHSSDLGVLVLDGELCIRRYTAHAAHLFRLLPQHVGHRLGSLAPLIQHQELEADVLRVLQTNQPIQREVATGDGDVYLLRILARPGRDGGVMVLLVDISELRRSEARVRGLSAIVESSGDAIFAIDAAGRIMGWSRGAEVLYGHSADESLGRAASLLLPEHRRGEADQRVHRALQGELVEPYETVHLARDGRPLNVSVCHAPIYDELGAIVGVSAIGRDIGKRKRHEAEVQQALRMRDQFMAMLSHELRNPLAALVNAVTLLQQGGHEERSERALSTIRRQCKHMARLLDDLLDVSRTRQEIELRKTRLDLRATVAAAVEAVQPMAGGRALEQDLPPEPVPVDGDADRLLQILVNLLTNALRHTEPSGRVRVRAAIESERAILHVSDDGCGIPAHMLERVFEPFVRVLDDDQLPRYRVSSGMGLGLALVRSFVRAHGGEVRALSGGPGKGAEFIVTLPLAPIEARPAAAEAGVDPAHELGPIVLVEDQEDSRMLLADILADAGYDVLPAADGRQALELITKHRPPLAIVDIGLPVLSGYEVARSVRARMGRGEIFLVALTGYGQQRDREAVLEAGFDQHLVKPVEAQTLLDVLRRRARLQD